MTPTTAPSGLTLKVTVGDTWMPLHLAAKPDETVAAVKARALASLKIDPARADGYEVKLGGARIRDEARTLSACGIKDGSAMIVLARRRRPVR
jgi:hypothetical protein